MSGTKIIILSDDNEFIFQRENKTVSYKKETKTFEPLNLLEQKNGQNVYSCYSILGNIEGKKLNYLVCAKKVEYIGKIINQPVYRIIELSYIPFKGNGIAQEDTYYIKMLDDFINRNPLFYSDSFDLTISFKKYNSINKQVNKSKVFPYTVSQYCWNYTMGNYFNDSLMRAFIYPVINGFFGKRNMENYGEDVKFILIARKDIRRSGMRFLIRGADANGNVANCVETEEILIQKNKDNIIKILSFVQLRGSIPLRWSQEPNLKLNPKILIFNDYPKNYDTFKIHIDECIKNYENICCINLVDKKKYQKQLGEYYERLVNKYKEDKEKKEKIEYAWFDFHHECKKMRYDNIKKLLQQDNVSKCIKSYDYTELEFDSDFIIYDIDMNDKLEDIFINNGILEFKKIQKGVFRTNCVDSLDRSNVVQSVLARYFLHLMLNELKLSTKLPTIDDAFSAFLQDFESNFKNIWADHGDCLALSYSGTGAMKSDFVRTGKRTLLGNLQDGLITSKRFFINNFLDGYNQDCHDYFLGILNPKKQTFKIHSLLLIQGIICISLFLGLIVPDLIFFKKSKETTGISINNLLSAIVRLIVILITVALTFFGLIKASKKKVIDFHTRH